MPRKASKPAGRVPEQGMTAFDLITLFSESCALLKDQDGDYEIPTAQEIKAILGILSLGLTQRGQIGATTLVKTWGQMAVSFWKVVSAKQRATKSTSPQEGENATH